MFPKIGVPQNGWFMMENHIKMDDLGVPLFLETQTSWWFQPIWKICSSNCIISSIYRGENNKWFETTTKIKYVKVTAGCFLEWQYWQGFTNHYWLDVHPLVYPPSEQSATSHPAKMVHAEDSGLLLLLNSVIPQNQFRPLLRRWTFIRRFQK